MHNYFFLKIYRTKLKVLYNEHLLCRSVSGVNICSNSDKKHIIRPQEIYFIQIQYTATGYMHNIHQHTIIIKFFTFQYVPYFSRSLLSHICPENLRL